MFLNYGQEVEELDGVASRMNVVEEGVVEEAEIGIVVRDGVRESAIAGDAEVSFLDLVPTTSPPTAAPAIASNKIAPIRHANFKLIPHTSRLPLLDSLFKCMILRSWILLSHTRCWETRREHSYAGREHCHARWEPLDFMAGK